MKAVEHNHAVPPEELMAYLDGELEPERALAVHAHLAGCGSCGALAAELRHTSSDMALWEVAAPVQSLQPPASPAGTASTRRSLFAWLSAAPTFQFAGAAAVVVVGLGLLMAIGNRLPLLERPRVAYRTAASPTEEGVASPSATAGQTRAIITNKSVKAETAKPYLEARPTRPVQQPSATAATPTQKIIRTVSMTIVAKEFESVREAIDRLLRDVGGFLGTMQASDVRNERSVSATLRVPASRLDETVRSLRTLGDVVNESQSGEDVTEQVRDIEARLKNSRNTEQRLTDVLRNRTGRVVDILEVEREIARVREEIERMDAQRLNFERQVEYSTLTVHVTERRQATLDLGPMPIRAQLRNAFVDGLKGAYGTLVAVLVWSLSVAPVAMLWAALLWWPVRTVGRRVRARTT